MPVMACTGLREVRPVCWCYLGEENERVRCVRGLDRGGGDHSMGGNKTYLSYWMTGKTV